MKILFCTNAFNIVSNGAAKFANVLFDEALNQGIEVRILTEDIPIEVTNSIYKLDLRIPILFKPIGQFLRMWKYYKRANLIKKVYNYDFVIYNNALIGLLSNLFSNNTIGLVHDYSNSSVNISSVIRKREQLSKRLIFHYVEKSYTLRKQSKLIVNSNYLKKELVNSYNCDESKIFVLNMLIEQKLIEKSKKIDLSQKIVNSILFVKSDFKLGGLFDLIDALNKFNDKVVLTIIGPTKNNHQLIIEKISNLLIEYEIHDYLPQETVYEYMVSHEVFCVPSHKEAFGLANIEAVCHGCKVVSTNVGGIPEVLNGVDNVFFSEPNNPERLLKNLQLALEAEYFVDRTKLYNQLQRFSSNQVMNDFKGIIDDVIEAHNV